MDLTRFEDMSGDNAFCNNCPDHEACMQGYPCSYVVLINFEYEERRANEQANSNW